MNKSRSHMQTIASIIGFTILAAACETAPDVTSVEIIEESSINSEQVADTIIQWWQGDYTNERQIQALREDGAPIWVQGAYEAGQKFGGHLPVTSYYRRVDLPAFGSRVLYLEEFTFDTNPYRQRIYTIAADDQDAVRVKLWYFNDKESYRGAHANLDMISGLTPEDMSPLPDNCDLVARRQDDGAYHLMMPKNQCKFGDKIFDYQVVLSADAFWFRDRIVDADTMQVTETAGSFTYHELDRISRQFERQSGPVGDL